MADQKLQFLLSADDKASAVFARVRKELGGLSTLGDKLKLSFAGIAASLASGLSIGALASLTRTAIDGLDALNDMAEAVGSTVENLSGLEDIALRTGTSVETLGSAMVRMNKALSDASRTKEVGEAFKALGLDVEKLKSLDPAEAFLQLASALDRFADDGNKARIVQELFGKSLLAINPLLKDAAAAGKLNATVTKEQAVAAAKFNDELDSMKKNVLDVSRNLAGPLVSAINQTIEAFRQGAKEGKGFFETLRDEQLKLLGFGGKNPILELQNRIAQLDDALKNPQLPEVFRAGFLEKRAQAAAELAKLLERSRSDFLKGDKDTSRVALPSLPAGLDGPDLKAAAAAKKAAEERIKLAEFAALQIVTIEEQGAADAAQAWKYWEQQKIDASKERADAAKLQWQQVFEFIDAQQEQEIQNGKDYLDSLAKESTEVADKLSLVFTSAAGNAITQFKSLKEIIKGIGADLLQLALQQTVLNPLKDVIGGALKGFSFAGLFADGGFIPPGQWGIVGERGPEIAYGGRSGTSIQAGGGGVVIHQTLNVGAGASRNEVAAAMVAAKQSAVSEIYDAARRGRVMA